MSSDKVKRVSVCAMFCACALMLTYLEVLFPLSAVIPIPGFRLGLSNIAVMALSYYYSFYDAFFVAILKCVISSVLFSNPVSFLYSLSGTAFSLLILLILCATKCRLFSFIGVSVLCASFHTAGQLAFALTVFGPTVFYYAVYLIPVSVGSGIITGVVIEKLSPMLEKIIPCNSVRGKE